jgi:hypothetical protein
VTRLGITFNNSLLQRAVSIILITHYHLNIQSPKVSAKISQYSVDRRLERWGKSAG